MNTYCNSGLALDQWHLSRSLNLLIMDCETQRFAVDGPVSAQRVNDLLQEAERAWESGRRMFCVPVEDIDKQEIIELGTMLGYEEWPVATMITLPEVDSPKISENKHPNSAASERANAQSNVDRITHLYNGSDIRMAKLELQAKQRRFLPGPDSLSSLCNGF